MAGILTWQGLTLEARATEGSNASASASTPTASCPHDHFTMTDYNKFGIAGTPGTYCTPIYSCDQCHQKFSIPPGTGGQPCVCSPGAININTCQWKSVFHV